MTLSHRPGEPEPPPRHWPPGGAQEVPRVPLPRNRAGPADPLSAAKRTGPPRRPTDDGGSGRSAHRHQELMKLLGAWALAACSPTEMAHVEEHLHDCAPCADEAVRLRDAVTLLEPPRTLDLDPGLRPKVLESCLASRPAQLPVPAWAAPYDAETARLDALLDDMADDEWRTRVRLRWHEAGEIAERMTTVAGVLDHLLAVDGLLSGALGLPDPLGARLGLASPRARTEARWREVGESASGPAHRPRPPWRAQTRALVRAAALTGGSTGERKVSRPWYGDPRMSEADVLPLSDLFLARAFACWVHAGDIAEAVDYPYEAPLGPHLRLLVDLVARWLPASLSGRRRAGLAVSPARLTTAGRPGRTLHLEVEGSGGGDWYIPLDSPTAAISRSSAREAVAHVALDDVVFCQLAAGRIAPEEAAAGQDGDLAAVHDVLFAAAALSRL